MDTCYSAAVEYFLSFFGSWRDGQDPAVLSLATIAPAPTSDAPVSSCEENKLHRGRCSMECEADMDFRRSWSLFSYFVFFLESLCVFFRIFFVRALYESEKPDGRQRAMCSLGISAENYLHWRASILPGLLPYCWTAVPGENPAMLGRLVVLRSEKNPQCHTWFRKNGTNQTSN
jgi:hypothetical protein